MGKKQEEFEKGNNWKIGSFKQVFEKEKPEALTWVEDVDSTILAAEWNDITSAFNAFFKSCKGQRNLKVGKPNFKSKKTSPVSITWTSMAKPRILRNGYLFLTKKLGPVKGKFHRWAEGDFKHATIKQTSTGKWFVKICVEKKDEPKNKNGKIIGIDCNGREEAFITMSDGTKLKCPRYLRKMQKQLNKQQKDLSRKKYAPFFQMYGRMPDFKNSPSDCINFKAIPVSNNYEKQKQKVALLHEKVVSQRKDWLHKLSREICNEYETVVVEDINLQTMAKINHGKVIGDQGFGMLRNMIAYKGNLVKVNPKNTSKTCHYCGYVNPKVKVGVNYWECPNCRAKHDRDINAALNILHKWNMTSQSIVGRERAESTNACGAPNGAAKQEVSISSLEPFGSE